MCLVVKDNGPDTIYRGQGYRDRIRDLGAATANPEILYLDEAWPQPAMAGLYAACHALVHPYRGEGFPMPIAEAMACGLPVVVPAHGACLEFCDASTAYLVPADEVSMPVGRVGHLDLVEDVRWAEVDRDALAATLREVFEHPDDARRVGERASAKVRSETTWPRATAVARERLEALAAAPARRLRAPVGARPAPVPAPMASPTTLSACLVVRDEEEFLERCLASIAGLADELVVVDTGSSDRTVEIARGHGARVFHAAWTDDFAAARNEVLAHATGDWILMVDADQTVDADDREVIRALIQTDEPVVYLLRQLNYTDPEGSASVIEHLTPRLFPNRPDLRYVGRIHEQLRADGSGRPVRHKPCGVTIHHHGDRPEIAARRRKTERYQELLEACVRDEPDDPFHVYNLGVSYQASGRVADAERELSRAIALCADRLERGAFIPYLPHAHVVLALALLGQGRPGDAAAACRDALRLRPDYADAHATLAAAEIRRGRLDAALSAYERALGCAGAVAFAPTDRAAEGWKSLLGIGHVHLLREGWADAAEALERAQALHPRHPEIRLGLAQAHLGLGQLEVAEALLRGIVTEPAEAVAAWTLLAEVCARQGRAAEAREILERLGGDAAHPPPLLVTRGNALIGIGDLDGALECYVRALQQAPNPSTLHNVGVVLARLGYPEEAEQAFAAARHLSTSAVAK